METIRNGNWPNKTKISFLAWLAASVFFTALVAVNDVLGNHKSLLFLFYANGVHFAFWLLVSPVVSKLARSLPFNHPRIVWNATIQLFAVTGIALLVTLGQWALVYFTFFPYRAVFPTFRSFLRSELVKFLTLDILIGIVLALAFAAWRALLDFQGERARVTDLERQLAVSQLEALKMQLHPHFLFNTLHTVAGLIMEEPTLARRMVVSLGAFLRRTLKNNVKPAHTLAEELEFADLYLGIQKLRLGDRLDLNYEIDPDTTRALVPYMLLQPLFENAIQHGAARVAGHCEIRFCAQRLGDKLRLTLQNDGTVRSSAAEEPRYGVGLSNIESRLRLHYRDQFTFSIDNRQTGGASVEISIPYATTCNTNALVAEVESSSRMAAHARSDR